MLLGALVSDSAIALLVPLFVMVGCTGLIGPNATALALDRQGELAGSASALLGLAHFGFGAVVPPLASLNGVSPVIMAGTVVGTTTAALLVHVVAVRARAPVPTGEADGPPVGTGPPRADRAAAWAAQWPVEWVGPGRSLPTRRTPSPHRARLGGHWNGRS